VSYVADYCLIPPHSAQLDAVALEAALRRHFAERSASDKSTRALYATDGSNYRQFPSE